MQRRFRSLALLAAVLLPPAAAASPLSLDDAIRHALDQNPELRASAARAEAAGARADSAWGALLPQVNLRYMARRSDNPLDAFADKLNTRSVNTATDLNEQALNYPATSTVHATTLSVELPLYTGGRLAAGLREAGRQADAARLAHQHHRQVTVYRTLNAYRSAQAATESLAVADAAVAAAREHAETTARLVRQGRIVASDRLTAELNLAAMQSLREQAASRQRLALDQLRQVLGWPAGRELVLPAWQRPTGGAPPVAAGEAETRALANRRDLRAHEAMVAAGEARVRAARAAFHPQVGVVAADSWYDDNAALDNKSQSIMGVVSLNLFSGGRDWHGLDAARREVEEARSRAEAARLAVRTEVRTAATRLEEAEQRMRIAEAGVEKAREAVRLIKQRYGEGRTILIDLLMAERVLVEARAEELAAALQRELAVAELELAEGRLAEPAATP